MELKYTTIIFDLDGTILNTIDDLADSVNYALSECGYPQHSVEAVCSFVGNGAAKLIERSAPEGISEAELKEYHRIFLEHYQQHCADKTRPYDGIPELLKKLRSMGAALAVVSNKPDSAVGPLCNDYFSGLFDIAIGDREGIRRKPCPDSVYEVMEKLGADKAKTLYVGDSDVDVETAKNAGVDCAAVLWGFRSRECLEEHGAQMIAGDSDELFAIICGEI